jgi:signal transduction histidine kinase
MHRGTARAWMRRPRTWFRDLPLFWKLLVPFFALMVIVGTAGGFRVVRELSSRAEAELNQELLQRSLNVRTLLRDRELYLLESVNFASNLQGMSAAIADADTQAVSLLMASVGRLKRDLDFVVILDERRRVVARSTGTLPSSKRRWDERFVVRALADEQGERHADILGAEDARTLGIASSVCASSEPCVPVGIAVVGMDLSGLLLESLNRASTENRGGEAVALYATSGGTLGTAGNWRQPASIPALARGTSRRQTLREGDQEFAILYTPYEVQGRRLGTLALQTPTAPIFAAARRAAIQLGLLLLIGMAGVIAIGALLSRFVVGQVRPLVSTVHRLGEGELSARAASEGTDEIGALAVGINQMAEQLQVSHETLDARVNQRTEEVQRLLGQRNELFASISHELRTPLAIILNQAAMLLEAAPKDAVVAHAGRRIDGSARELLALVNEILDFARVEAGMLTIEPKPVSIRRVLEEIIPTLQPLFDQDDLSLTMEIPRNLPRVVVDPSRLRSILQNLLDNAVKYTPPKGRIQVRAVRDGDQVEVTVSDTGVGIPPEAGEFIFEPFYRVQGMAPLRGQPSTGLGLALTKRLVEAHGGRISFESVQGKGSTFRFTLPQAPRGSAVG